MNARHHALAALGPAWLCLIVGYAMTASWSVWLSLTTSGALPNGTFAGLAQYRRLFADDRWHLSVWNLALFCVLLVFASLVLGAALGFAVDRLARGQSAMLMLFLYPYALSFIVTGLAWQWLMDSGLGLQESVRQLGWAGFTFDPLHRPGTALYALVIAGVWQVSGLVAAIVLAGLRGIDPEIRRAALVDGIPHWRFHVSVALPMLRPVLAAAAFLLTIMAVETYDLVVAMTGGGPGLSTQMPGLFVVDYLFQRGNVGLAMAASTVMLATILAMSAPFLHLARMRVQARRNP